MRTEDAPTKWCPFASIGKMIHVMTTTYSIVATNHDSKSLLKVIDNKHQKCMGADCAMWRAWDYEHGYCGLAGREE